MGREKTEDILVRLRGISYVALPLIIQGFVFQLQSLTDKAFLGNLDTQYVSAVGAAQMPYGTTVDSLVAMSVGLIIIVSRLFGADKKDKIPQYTKSTIFHHTFLGVILFLIWQCATRPILEFFQIDAQIINYSITYVKICSCYLVFIGIDCSLQAMLQGMGNTKPIMYSGILKVGLNLLFSWVLIFGKFGFPALYVTGAAIGTLVANMISFLFIICYCMIVKKKQFSLTKINREWLSWKPYKEVIQLGVPVGLEYLLWNASNLLLIRFINGFSYQDMAIYTLTFGCQCVVYVIFDATSKATLTIMGQEIGAQRVKKANQFFYTSIIFNFCIVAIAALVFIWIPYQLLDIFSNDTLLIKNGIPFLQFIGLIMLPQSMNVICGNGIRAYGDTRWMLVSQIIGSTLVVSISWFLVVQLHMNMMAIYITILIDETVRGMVNFIYYRKKYGSKCSLQEECMV